MKIEQTSAETASKAARILQDENSTPDEKSVAASALAQTPDKFKDASKPAIEYAMQVLAKELRENGNFYNTCAFDIAKPFIDAGLDTHLAIEKAKSLLDVWKK